VALETQQVLRNLQAVLRQAGATAAQVVRTTVYLVDLADFSTVNGLYAEVFGQGVAPARACVQVAALPLGARVEIDAVACLL
jgi:reactive intermediate/imine deaminase